MKENNFKCCFCAELIESEGIDITTIIVISNWDKETYKQQEQQLFCHINCLKERLHNNIPFYLTELED